MAKRGLFVGALAAAAMVAASPVALARGGGHEHHHHDHGHGDGGGGKLLFFASDGMRQDAIERYAGDGVVPGFKELLKHGAFASGHGLLTQAPPNTGAGWFTLATGAWPAVHGSTNNTFHINGPPFDATRTAAFSSAERAAGRDARPGGRARRQEGRPDRVGRRPQRLDQRPDARLPLLPLRPRRGDQLHRAAGQPAVRRQPSGSSSTTARSPSHASRLDRRVRSRTARPRRCACGCSTPATDKYGLNAYIYDSKNDHKTHYDRVLLLPHQGRRRHGRRPQAGRVGRRQGQDHRRRPRRQDRRVPGQGRAARPRPLARPPVPHLGHPRERDLAELARRGRLHRQLRGLRRREVPVLAGRRLRGARVRHRQRGDLRRAGPLLGEALPAADQVRAQQVPARPRAGRLPGHRRVPAPVPRPGHQEAAQRRAATRPTTTSRSTARRTAASQQREAFIQRRLRRAPTRRCGSRRQHMRDSAT